MESLPPPPLQDPAPGRKRRWIWIVVPVAAALIAGAVIVIALDRGRRRRGERANRLPVARTALASGQPGREGPSVPSHVDLVRRGCGRRERRV